MPSGRSFEPASLPPTSGVSSGSCAWSPLLPVYGRLARSDLRSGGRWGNLTYPTPHKGLVLLSFQSLSGDLLAALDSCRCDCLSSPAEGSGSDPSVARSV